MTKKVISNYPDKICSHVRPHIDIEPERITVVYGGQIPDWIVDNYAPDDNQGKQIEPAAMTIGYKTWYKPKGWTLETIFHEIKHSDQFYHLQDDFQEKYSRQIADLVNSQIYDDYKEVPLEKEAYEFQNRMLELWKRKNGNLWTGRAKNV